MPAPAGIKVTPVELAGAADRRVRDLDDIRTAHCSVWRAIGNGEIHIFELNRAKRRIWTQYSENYRITAHFLHFLSWHRGL